MELPHPNGHGWVHGVTKKQTELLSNDADVLTVFRALDFELYFAVFQRKQCVVFTDTYMLSPAWNLVPR